MQKEIFAKDRPDDCRGCRFGNRKGGCTLGKENCFYVTKIVRKEADPCDGCPYSRGSPCIGWCTLKIIREGKEAPCT